MRNGKIGVGIIGASPDGGWAGYTHVPAIKSIPDFELAAVSTSRRESAAAAKTAFNVPLAFDNHADLVARPEVDLVVVSVRVPKHFELTSAAIAAGKSVLCEWPLGNGLDEAVTLADMARKKGVKTWVGLQTRASPTTSYIRDLVRQGYIGDVLSTTLVGAALFWGGRIDQAHAFIFDKRNGITPLTISGAHRIDALCYTLGEFKDLSATVANRLTTATVVETGATIAKTADDQIAITGTLHGGAVGAVHYRGGAYRGTNLLWEINGTQGDLQVVDAAGHGQMPDLQLLAGKGEDKGLKPLAIPQDYFRASREAAPGVAFNVAQNYIRLADDMKNGTHTCPTFDDAVVRHRMLDAVERASATGTRQSYATT
jgi:predicted dehydrogenase